MAITGLGAAERGGHSTRARGGCQPSPPALRPGYLGSDKRERVVSEDRSQSSTAHTSGYLGRGCWVVSRMSNAEIETSVCPALGPALLSYTLESPLFVRRSGFRRAQFRAPSCIALPYSLYPQTPLE